MRRSILFLQFMLIIVMVALFSSGCATTTQSKASKNKAQARIEELIPKPLEFDQNLKTTNKLVISAFHSESDLTALETKSKVTVKAVPGSDSVIEFNGTIEIDAMSGRQMVWNPGVEHTIIGVVILKADGKPFIFESDSINPLVFLLDRKLGYVYQVGRGIVTYPNGEKIQLEKK